MNDNDKIALDRRVIAVLDVNENKLRKKTSAVCSLSLTYDCAKFKKIKPNVANSAHCNAYLQKNSFKVTPTVRCVLFGKYIHYFRYTVHPMQSGFCAQYENFETGSKNDNQLKDSKTEVK